MAAQGSDTRMDRAAPDVDVATEERERAPAEERAGTGWGWPFLATVGLGGFALMTWAVASKIVLPFDQPLFDAASGLGQYMVAWRDLSDSANIPLIVIGVAIVAFLLFTRQRAEALLVIGVLAAVTAGSEAVKLLVARPRPPGFDNNVAGVVYSYPSGHVLEAVTIYGIIAVLLWRSSLPTVVRVVVPILFSILDRLRGHRPGRGRRPLSERRPGRLPRRHRLPGAVRLVHRHPGATAGKVGGVARRPRRRQRPPRRHPRTRT